MSLSPEQRAGVDELEAYRSDLVKFHDLLAEREPAEMSAVSFGVVGGRRNTPPAPPPPSQELRQLRSQLLRRRGPVQHLVESIRGVETSTGIGGKEINYWDDAFEGGLAGVGSSWHVKRLLDRLEVCIGQIEADPRKLDAQSVTVQPALHAPPAQQVHNYYGPTFVTRSGAIHVSLDAGDRDELTHVLGELLEAVRELAVPDADRDEYAGAVQDVQAEVVKAEPQRSRLARLWGGVQMSLLWTATIEGNLQAVDRVTHLVAEAEKLIGPMLQGPPPIPPGLMG